MDTPEQPEAVEDSPEEGEPTRDEARVAPEKRSWPDRIWDAINATSTTVLVVITAVYVYQNQQLVKQAQLTTQLVAEQLEVSVEPYLQFLPKRTVEAEIPVFDLELANLGRADVRNVEVFVDPFAVIGGKDSPATMQYANDVFDSLPSFSQESLQRNARMAIRVDIREANQSMIESFETAPKGVRIRMLRLRARYERAVDGREFEVTKCYIVAGHGNHLLDFSDRELPEAGVMPVRIADIYATSVCS